LGSAGALEPGCSAAWRGAVGCRRASRLHGGPGERGAGGRARAARARRGAAPGGAGGGLRLHRAGAREALPRVARGRRSGRAVRLRRSVGALRCAARRLAPRLSPRLPVPGVEELVHVAPLRLGEGRVDQQAPGLDGVVVRDRGLETLAAGQRLPQLTPEPAEQADPSRIHGPRAYELTGTAVRTTLSR